MKMGNKLDVKVCGVELYFLPTQMRVPMKFGKETIDSVTCVRVKITVEDTNGKRAVGWGETPLSVTWVWPAELSYGERYNRLSQFCRELSKELRYFEKAGHPIEISQSFQENKLFEMTEREYELSDVNHKIPHLAALVCFSPFDIAIHDAYGKLHDKPVYETYQKPFMNKSLDAYLDADGENVSFEDKYPVDYLNMTSPKKLPVWHLVGGVDLMEEGERTGSEPDDSYPVSLRAWIQKEKLKCLKIKLRGTDVKWDFDRLVLIGRIAIAEGVDWLSTDFNCTVADPEYVNQILDRLMKEYPRIYGMILYVEQPFPYDLEENQIDVSTVSYRKPLFMDESAHDWRLIRLGRRLGWSGVALKTCKSQTGALLSLCWAKAHGLPLMVQDLTNPMLAQIPHLLLAAHADTIMGVECNAMQFYPEASLPEAKVHPGVYERVDGVVSVPDENEAGFPYKIEEVERKLPNVDTQY